MLIKNRIIFFICSIVYFLFIFLSIFATPDNPTPDTLLYIDLCEFANSSKLFGFNDDPLYYLSLHFGSLERLDFPKRHLSLLYAN